MQVDAGDWELADYLESRASVDEDEELTMSVDASVSCRYHYCHFPPPPVPPHL